MADRGPRAAVVRADAAARAAVGAPRAARPRRRDPAPRSSPDHARSGQASTPPGTQRHLQLPSPIRDVRTLRTLLLLDLDAHPPPAAVDRVTIVIDPTPGRVVQHTLVHARASDAGAALDAARAAGRADGAGPHRRAGHGRFVSSRGVRDGAVCDRSRRSNAETAETRREIDSKTLRTLRALRRSAESALNVVSALASMPPAGSRARGRRARAAHACHDRPPRLRGRSGAHRGRSVADVGTLVGGSQAGQEGRRGRAVGQEDRIGPGRPHCQIPPALQTAPWDRDEWDVALADGAVYRMFQDRETGGWFIDALWTELLTTEDTKDTKGT